MGKRVPIASIGKYYISDGEVASAAGQPGTQMAGIGAAAHPPPENQLEHPLALCITFGTGVTLLVAVVCGSATGAAMKAFAPQTDIDGGHLPLVSSALYPGGRH